MRTGRGVVCALIVVLCGCPESGEAQRAARREAAWTTHQPALEALGARLPELAAAAKEQAPVREASCEASEPLDCRSKSEGHNTLVVQVEALESEGKPSYLLDLSDRQPLRVAQAVHGGEVPSSVHDMARAAGLRYALVLRVREVRGPVVPQGGKLSSFEPGYVRGDALLYAVEDGSLKGGFPFEGTSSESVSAGVEDPEAWLQNDLFRRTRRAIHDAIEALGPGNQGPLGPDDRLR